MIGLKTTKQKTRQKEQLRVQASEFIQGMISKQELLSPFALYP